MATLDAHAGVAFSGCPPPRAAPTVPPRDNPRLPPAKRNLEPWELCLPSSNSPNGKVPLFSSASGRRPPSLPSAAARPCLETRNRKAFGLQWMFMERSPSGQGRADAGLSASRLPHRIASRRTLGFRRGHRYRRVVQARDGTRGSGDVGVGAECREQSSTARLRLELPASAIL